VQAHGERATSRHFVLLVASREVARDGDVSPEAIAPSRLGVVATRKVGDATMRNRIKRVCRECFRLWPGFVPDGIDLVVIAREGADTLPLDAVREEWARARPALLKRCESALRPRPAALPESAENSSKPPRKRPAQPHRRAGPTGQKPQKGRA
jgi:ribonuclease P protein component